MTLVKDRISVEQVAESIGVLSEKDQRQLAALVLRDRKLEPFVEELEDSLACERAAEENGAEPFAAEETSRI